MTCVAPAFLAGCSFMAPRFEAQVHCYGQSPSYVIDSIHIPGSVLNGVLLGHRVDVRLGCRL